MANTYLSKTLGTPTNNKKWTFSAWCKRSAIDVASTLISSDTSTTDTISMASNGKFNYYVAAGNSGQLTTSRLFQDVSAWYHIVVAVDTTQATASNRIKIYINGVQETVFSTETYPSQNFDTKMNSAIFHTIGGYSEGSSGEFWNGSMSHINFIDGSQELPTAFGETDSTTGEWKIKTSPSVTYGNNGFFILKDGNSVTDQSGNSNNFTVTAGTLTNTEDNPSNNFATLNPLNNTQGATFSNGNTKAVNVQNDKYYTSTLAMPSGKYYWEVKPTTIGNRNGVGVTNVSRNFNSNSLTGTNYGYIQLGNNTAETNGTHTGTVPTISNDNIVCYAFDSSTNILYYSVDANLNTASANKFTLASDEYIIFCKEDGGTVGTNEFNFGNGYFGTTAVSSAGTNASGNGIFEYDTPTGYTALSTKGLNL
jgi:hypothetical protein